MKVNRWTQTPILVRFLMRVALPDEAGGCWQWTGTRRPKGYGRFWEGRRHVEAHRFSYEVLVGPIPEGLQLDHLCKNPGCVRPDHLEPVTLQENLKRGNSHLSSAIKASRITHCPHGHIYDEGNTFFYKGHRYCRTCHRESERRRRGKAVAS